jgi:hypothetical protein
LLFPRSNEKSYVIVEIFEKTITVIVYSFEGGNVIETILFEVDV